MTLKFVFISRDWIGICRLEKHVYPFMLQDFSVHMSFMSQDAFSHTVTIRHVSFKVPPNVITQLLWMSCTSKSSTILENIETKWVPNVCTSASAIDPVDSRVEGYELQGGDESEIF